MGAARQYEKAGAGHRHRAFNASQHYFPPTIVAVIECPRSSVASCVHHDERHSRTT